MTRVNLLQPRLPSQEILAQRRVRSARLAIVGLAALSAAALVWMLISRFAWEDKLAATEAEIAAETSMAKEATALDRAIQEADTRAQFLAELPQKEERIGALVAAINAVQPAGCSVQQVAVEADGSLRIAGTAASHQQVADYVDKLRALPALAGVTFEGSETPNESQNVTFTLQAAMALPAESAAEGGDGE